MKNRRKKPPKLAKVSPSRFDPTRTGSLRRALSAEISRRFALIKGQLVKLILDDDSLGLKEEKHDPFDLAANVFCPTGPGGGKDNSCGTGKTTVSITGDPKESYEQTKAHIDKVYAKLGLDGPMHETIPALVGAPDGSTVTISSLKREGRSLFVHTKHAEFTSERLLVVTSDGKYIENEYLRVHTSGTGLGSRIFASQVTAASAAGFSHIETMAVGDAKELAKDKTKTNGYYTWPLLGYDGKIPEKSGAQAEFPEAESMLDLMSSKKGRDWWKANGTTVHNAKFDLTPGSRSMQVMEAYLEERSKRSTSEPTKNSIWNELGAVWRSSGLTSNVFCATGEGGGIDPTCSPRNQKGALTTLDKAPTIKMTAKSVGAPREAVLMRGNLMKTLGKIDTSQETHDAKQAVMYHPSVKRTTVDIPIASITPLQAAVSKDGVRHFIKTGERQEQNYELPVVVKLPDGRHILHDGTHRYVADKLSGVSRMKVSLYEIPPTANVLGEKHDFASTHFEIECPVMLEAFSALQSTIDPLDVIKLENDPHITVRYGLHDNPELFEKVSDLAMATGSVVARIKGLSLFHLEAKEQDVLKWDLDSPQLYHLNRELGLLPNTQTYDYHPHLTVAYLKAGTGAKYCKEPWMMHGHELWFNELVISSSDETKERITINCGGKGGTKGPCPTLTGIIAGLVIEYGKDGIKPHEINTDYCNAFAPEAARRCIDRGIYGVKVVRGAHHHHLEVGGKAYDAESPTGVSHAKELNYYKRNPQHLTTNRERRLVVNAPWRFEPDAEKIKLFQQWLRKQLAQYLTGKTEEELWRRYTEEGFKKGAGRAFDDTRPEDVSKSLEGQQQLDWYKGTKEEFLRSSFGRPVAIEKVQLLASRSFDEIKGLTEKMITKLSRTLTDGLVQGKGARDIARDLSKELDLDRKRAEIIARTEIVRAHAEGQLVVFEQLGVEALGVAVEWATAGDERVCPLCRPLEGAIFKVAEAKGMLPRHPACRCAWIPAGVGEATAGQQRTQARIVKAVKTSQKRASKRDKWKPAIPLSKIRPKPIITSNVFCKTGPGGGVDPSCALDEDLSRSQKETLGRLRRAVGDGSLTHFFHGTTQQAYAHILKHGLLPGGGAVGTGKVYAEDDRAHVTSVYLAKSSGVAIPYAIHAGRMTYSKAILLKVTIPSEHAHKVSADEADTLAYKYPERIPPEWITVARSKHLTRNVGETVLYAVILVKESYAANRIKEYFATCLRDKKGHCTVGGSGSKAEKAQSLTLARKKIRNAGVPDKDAVKKAREELRLAREGLGRAGGEARGGSAASRRKQRENLFNEWGGDKKGYVVCPWSGIKMHWTDDPKINPDKHPKFERGKIFVKCQGGGYQLGNLIPESFTANRSRNDKRLRKENSDGC